jgi:flavodoxin
MKALVIYDTTFGNTQKVAETVAETLGKGAKAMRVSALNPKDLAGLDLLVVGSPILGWRPSEKTQAFLAGLHPGQLKGVKSAAFDTRISLFIHGDAAGKISAALAAAGAQIVAAPMGFTVKGSEGPLKDGELEKAAKWAGEIAASI